MEHDTDHPKVPETNPGLTKPNMKDDLKTLPMPELQAKLGSSPDGLSQAEAQKRLTQYGPNEIEEKKTNLFLKFLSYFWGPIPWMIEIAVILSGVVQHWPDFFIILLLLVANAVVGFWEEREAGNAIEALKAKLAVKARVKRDGKWTTPAVLVHMPCADFMDGGAWHANRGHLDSGLWAVYDTPGLELGRVRVGICAAVVPRERPRETARV